MMFKDEFESVCQDCKRSNINRIGACGGFGTNCPVDIISNILAKRGG